MPEKKSHWIKYAVFAAIVAAAYFINVEVQTRLGQSVLAEMKLERHSLPDALISAKANNKLVIADLSAIWCPTCRNLDKHLFSNPEVQAKIEEKYLFVRIEYESEEGEAFREKYEVHSFPTLLVLSANGEKIRELPITTYPEEFISAL